MSTEPFSPEEEQPEPQERRGRARERHLKRKEQRQGKDIPSTFSPPRIPTMPRASLPRSSRQLSPSGGFKLPQLKLPATRMPLFIIGAIVLVILGVIILGQLRNRPTEAGPNAIWAFTEWTYVRRSDDAVAAFVQQLRDNQIGTVYALVTYLKPDGTWAGNQGGRFDDIADDVEAFVTQFKRLYPEANLLAWVGLQNGVNPETYGEGQTIQTLSQTVTDFSQRATGQLGFDGVFLQVEQVINGDENFMILLRDLRTGLGEENTLAVAVPPDWTPTDAGITLPPLYAPGTVWDQDYKQRVALIADQITVMAYNSGFTNSADYVNWVAYQTRAYAEAVSELDSAATVIIGVPTNDAIAQIHDPAIENITTSAEGVRQGMTEAAENASVIQGIALYYTATLDDDEWAQFRDAWLR